MSNRFKKLIDKSISDFLNYNCRNGHLTVWQCSLGLDEMSTVESNINKRLKLSNADDDNDDEDDIDLSKGEERERYLINKAGIS